jgi:hypothetical protein
VLIKLNLLANLIGGRPRVIAKSIAYSILGHKDEEFIFVHRQAELAVDIEVVLGSLVTGTAGAVEG